MENGGVILQIMKGIDPKIMMEIWRKLVAMERSSDFELANRANIAHGNITNWQSPNAPKIVRFSTLKQIEDNLGYSIDVKESGEYTITKRDVPSGVRESSPEYQLDFSRTHWKSEEDRKKFYDAIKKLSEVDPANRDAIYQIINSMGK